MCNTYKYYVWSDLTKTNLESKPCKDKIKEMILTWGKAFYWLLLVTSALFMANIIVISYSHIENNKYLKLSRS